MAAEKAERSVLNRSQLATPPPRRKIGHVQTCLNIFLTSSAWWLCLSVQLYLSAVKNCHILLIYFFSSELLIIISVQPQSDCHGFGFFNHSTVLDVRYWTEWVHNHRYSLRITNIRLGYYVIDKVLHMRMIFNIKTWIVQKLYPY